MVFMVAYDLLKIMCKTLIFPVHVFCIQNIWNIHQDTNTGVSTQGVRTSFDGNQVIVFKC